MDFIEHPLIKPGSVEKRAYQQNIVNEFLTKGSTLVVAPTALGKTIIAACIIAEKIKDGGKALFLAPTRPLALQHLKTLKQVLNLPEEEFGVLIGTVPEKNRMKAWEEAKIITATPQTVESDILNGRAFLNDLKVVVFDEAHRAVKGYSYVFIAQKVKEKNPEAKFLALTASPGSSAEKIQAICDNLFIENIVIKTETDPDVVPYVNPKKLVWKKIELPEEFRKPLELLKKAYENNIEGLKLNNKKVRSKKQLLDLQAMIGNKKNKNYADFQLMLKCSKAIKAQHALELLETQGVEAALNYFERLSEENAKSSKELLACPEVQKTIVLLKELKEKGIKHPKLEKLVEIVKQETEQGNKVIVFSHYRDTSIMLKKALEQAGVTCERFIGQASKKGDKGIPQKKQLEIIQRFRNDEFKVLIATSVGEEGLDIPSVDTVVFYEPVPSEIRSIQRKGRTGRHKEGKIIILMAKGTRDETNYWASVTKEKKMKKIISELPLKKNQAKLSEFVNENPKVVVFADLRELGSKVIEALMKKAEVKTMMLKVGDYLLSERVVVERKTYDDFINSIIDGRLFKQLKAMREQFEKPILIIEGEKTNERKIHENAVNGAIASAAIDYSIPVIFTVDPEQTADLLLIIAKREQFENKKEPRLRGEKKPMTLKAQQKYLIEGLPGIGPNAAESLLKHFKTPERVITATEEELVMVEGIGKKKAEKIRKVVTSEYEE